MTTSYVQTALDKLLNDFEEFKQTNEERLALLSKGKTDPLTEEKLSRINKALDTTQQKVNLLARRPMIGQESGTSAQEAEHKKAFLNYLRHGHEQDLRAYEKKAYTQEDDGGYFLPSLLANEVYRTISEGSPLRNLAYVVQTKRHQYEIIKEKGEQEVLWGSQNIRNYANAGTATAQLDRLVFPIHTLFARPQISQELLDDSPENIEKWLIDVIADKMARAENKAFISGTGDSQPLGFLTYAARPDIAADRRIEVINTGVRGGFPALNPENIIIDTLYSLKTRYLKRATWIMSRSALAEVRKMKTPEGHYLWQPALSADLTTHTLLGYPIIVSDDMPALRDHEVSMPIAIGDWHAGLLIAIRTGLSVLRDQYSQKPNIELLITQRLGGGVMDNEAIKVIQTGSEEKSPSSSIIKD